MPADNVLADMVERSLKNIAEVKKVEVEFIWEPAWSVDRMTSYAKMALGIH